MRFLVEFEKRLYFQGFEGIFGVRVVIFDIVKRGENVDFSMFCRTHYRTRKWWFRCGNIRYALSGNRQSVLKCKLCPLWTEKDTIIVQYYYIFLSCQVKILYTLRWSSLSYCKVKILDNVSVFDFSVIEISYSFNL